MSELPELYKRAGLLIFGYLFPKSSVRMNNHPDEAYTSSLCTSCDDSFFEIHEHSLNRCDVVVSHDTRTLNWLYFSKARWFKRLVIQCRRSRDNYLAGYMVFDFERNKMTDPGNMRLMEMRIADPDPRVLPSLLGFAIEMGKQNNAALLVLWADNTETDRYFKNTLSLRRVVQHYRYIRYPDLPDTEKTKHDKACPSLIYPPQ
jgi:hypothetical protein